MESMRALRLAVLSPCNGRVHNRVRSTIVQRPLDGDAIYPTSARAPRVLHTRANEELRTTEKGS